MDSQQRAREEYNRHLTNVQRVRVRSKGKGGKLREAWIPKSDGARHDFHDAKTYNLALALGPCRCEASPSRRRMLADQAAERERGRGAGGGRQKAGLKNHDGREDAGSAEGRPQEPHRPKEPQRSEGSF